jgi:hypothetical protein
MPQGSTLGGNLPVDPAAQNFDDGMQIALLANSGTLIKMLQAEVMNLMAQRDALRTQLEGALDEISALTARNAQMQAELESSGLAHGPL